LCDLLGIAATAGLAASYEGDIEDAGDLGGRIDDVAALLLADDEGCLGPTAGAVLDTARTVAARRQRPLTVVLFAAPDERIQRIALGRLAEFFGGPVLLAPLVRKDGPGGEHGQGLPCLGRAVPSTPVVVGEAWMEGQLAALFQRSLCPGELFPRVRRVLASGEMLLAESSRMGGKLRVLRPLPLTSPLRICVGPAAESPSPPSERGLLHVRRVTAASPAGRMALLLDEVRRAAGVARLADAEFILDVGFGVGGRDGYEAVIVPLEQALRDLGVRGLVVGGSRKVTEELHLLPPDRQIGQSGVGVDPRVLIAVGVSGAPQHLNYIGQRAVIVAFNRDPEAPLMTLNRRQPRPKVLPVVGDLFVTVPALTAALRDGKG
jgi:hypothetical protein